MRSSAVKKIFLICLAALIFPALASAHPGKQDEQGCHVCKKNCDAWSVPWNVKHCHGGETDAPSQFMGHVDGIVHYPAEQKTPGWEYGMHISRENGMRISQDNGMRIKQIISDSAHNSRP